MKMAVIAMLLCVLPMTCSAESLQDRIGEPKIDITEVREYGTGNTVGYKANFSIERCRASE